VIAEGFKKTETTSTPSADKKPIENVNDELMKDAPVHVSSRLVWTTRASRQE
jgi:hypothetical protein